MRLAYPVHLLRLSRTHSVSDRPLPITVLIAAKNEAANIGRCLSTLAPAQRVLVVDSNSDDSTAQIARHAGAQVIGFQYQGGCPKKRQWALDTLDVQTPWVLLLDADEMVPEALWKEIEAALGRAGACDAYLVRKSFHFLGRRFRFGGFSHSAVILFRRGRARFERLLEDAPRAQDMEVHERLIVDGRLGRLKTPLIHQDFKDLESYIHRHNKYSTWEARLRHSYLKSGRWGLKAITPRLFGNAQEARRFLKAIAVRIPFEPAVWFAYHYFFRLGFLEGRAGLIASQLRSQYIAQVRAKLYELVLSGRAPEA